MDDRAIQRELDQERLHHRLFFRRSVAVCNCGKSYVDPTKGDIRWRHDVHVKEVLERLDDRLRGISNGS
ncbi:MAG: hypothetical protein NDI90_15495 [Nitrospira sp. BO4]|nr:hypothetical protein [Nitrospira sp. BO4]